MDSIYDSCYSLNAVAALGRQISPEPPPDEFDEILGSCRSFGRYEKRNFKNLIPQISAALIVSTMQIVVGISLVYSAILIPQLTDDPTFEKITFEDGSWIVSVLSLTMPIFVLATGFLMDKFGRLNTLKFAVVPGLAGWITIALSHNFATLMVGRILTSVALALGSSPTVVYITEIARADMRGSLISFLPTLTSLGMVLTYLEGWFVNWRTVAWTCTLYTIVPGILIFFVPESPSWLVSKRRHAEAKKSLDWLNRYQPQPVDQSATLTELQLALLERERDNVVGNFRDEKVSVMQGLFKPTGLKPMIIMIILFTFQRTSGIFTVLFYSISFFQEIGTTVDPYLASIAIATVRMLMSLVNSYVFSRSRRRPLMMISCIGCGICILCSGLVTSLIKSGGAVVPGTVQVTLLVLFIVLSMVGFIPVPVSMMAEVFPLEIRGVAYAICNASAHVIMFVSLKTYPWLLMLFGGIAGVQYFFASACFACFAFSFIVLPETYNMKLRDIEEYFKHDTFYLFRKNRNNDQDINNKTDGDDVSTC